MRRISLILLLLLAVLLGLFVALRWFPDTVRNAAPTFSLLTNVFAFSSVVFAIALLSWIMRTLVESDPDPFLLNLTFFAFAGQSIRTIEFIYNGHTNGFLLFLGLIAVGIVGCQALILRAHMHTTKTHYKALLAEYKKTSCSDHEIEHWASVVLQITGTDFSPGNYFGFKGLEKVFPSGPRAKSRMDALSILPETDFRKAGPSGSGLTAELLVVPAEDRVTLWCLYRRACAAAWIVFMIAILISQKKS
ncbi:MAG TPA: hypothetical protein VJU77_08505 [Chthoniobacterales bacterium]|nr:hypothetical protein [Chthoniobacterales bacterium]